MTTSRQLCRLGAVRGRVLRKVKRQSQSCKQDQYQQEPPRPRAEQHELALGKSGKRILEEEFKHLRVCADQ